jgi:hypothetical protein
MKQIIKPFHKSVSSIFQALKDVSVYMVGIFAEKVGATTRQILIRIYYLIICFVA